MSFWLKPWHIEEKRNNLSMKFWVENMVKEQYEVRFTGKILLDFILSLEFHRGHMKSCKVIFNWPEIWCRTFISNQKTGLTFYQKNYFHGHCYI